MRYSTDITDNQWEMLRVYFETPKGAGRPRKHSIREILNACFYLLKTGCQWRMLPKDFPPWKTVHGKFNEWSKNGTWDYALRELHKVLRVLDGRTEQPTIAIIDSQSVKTTRKKRALTQAKK